MEHSGLRWYVTGGVVATVAYFFMPDATGLVLYDLIGASAVVAILVGLRRYRPVRPLSWWCFAAGQASFVIGDVIYNGYAAQNGGEVPFPSSADLFYVLGYPILAVGLLIMIRGRSRGVDVAGNIDAAIVATGLTLLSWTFFVKPVALDASILLIERAVTVGYPVGDVLLLAMTARLLAGSRARSVAFWLLGVALALLLIADVGFAALNLFHIFEAGPLDAFWMLSYVLWGAAALHPSMRELTEVAPERDTGLTPSRLTLLAATSLIAPAVLAYQYFRGLPIDAPAIVIGCVVLFLLVVLRMAGLVKQVQDQAAQLAALAHNDGLTGVPNRRAWDLEVPREMARARRKGWLLHVALIDLDHFKDFNDLHGHQGGDRLLREATAAWLPQLRESDLLTRYGGDEFALLLPDSSTTQVVAVLERLSAVNPFDQTLSCGVAAWDGSESPEDLIARADRALYEAKRAGRARIVAAPTPTEPDTEALVAVTGRPGGQ
jgi:diguanylate cyclase (GGDEF)-like protein